MKILALIGGLIVVAVILVGLVAVIAAIVDRPIRNRIRRFFS